MIASCDNVTAIAISESGEALLIGYLLLMKPKVCGTGPYGMHIDRHEKLDSRSSTESISSLSLRSFGCGVLDPLFGM